MPPPLSSSDTVAVIADPIGVLAYACGYHCPPTVAAEDIIIAWLISLPSGSAVTLAAHQAVTTLRAAERATPDNARAAMRERLIELLTSLSQVPTARLTAPTAPAAPPPGIAR